uniref:Uncharacterized protein n=1 Tax=Avena sativa TaxID=4498 RepID=A0ACD6AUF5_AVESA
MALSLVEGAAQSLVAPSLHALFLLCTILIVLSSNTIIFTSAQASNRTEDDRQALLCFKSGISRDPDGVLGSWHNDSLNFCSWQGVTCSMTLPIRVVSIQFRSTLLRGTLSSCMVALTSLVQLDLQNTTLSGSIPDEIGELPSLQTLELAGNRLEGNSLSGTIPASLGNASSLRSLLLAQENLTGSIPETLGQIPNLNVLDLRGVAEPWGSSVPGWARV